MLQKILRKIKSKYSSVVKKFRKRKNITGNVETPNVQTSNAYALKIDSFINSKGEFDYAKYKSVQTEGNKAKINKVWVLEENIKFLSKYLKSNLPNPEFGICHGTRRGKEQMWFAKYLGCEVIGTEISDTALDFPKTIQWDFHEIKDEWVGNVDFIYSNSFDHSYDPGMCLNNWIKCLKPNGICILEHTDFHGLKGVTDLDPFGAELLIMPYLVLKWSKGEFAVKEILEAPAKGEILNHLNFLIIQKN